MSAEDNKAILLRFFSELRKYRFVDGKIVEDWGIQVACSPTDNPWS
jgi:hypothetical protein